MIYLDQAATSWPKPPAVLSAVERAMENPWGNPGRSSYEEAFQAVETILDCRQLLASLFHASDPLRFCFTANATEALNLAIKGSVRPGDHIVCSSMEHNAVWRPLIALSESQQDISFSVAQAGPDGTVTAGAVLRELRPNTRLVVILHASNVTGTINPIEEIGQALREKALREKALRGKDCFFLVDASQSAGSLSIDVEAMHIDMLAFPGHKGLLGPQGTGGLYVREGLTLKPLREGGTGSDSALAHVPELMPDRYETGTMNTPGIAGLQASLQYLHSCGLPSISSYEKHLTCELMEGLAAIPGLRIFGPAAEMARAPVVSFTLENWSCNQLSEALATRFSIASRPGLHCAYLAHKTIGTEESGTVRFSLGPFNTGEQIQKAILAVRILAQG